jgi:hypothetical protein
VTIVDSASKPVLDALQAHSDNLGTMQSAVNVLLRMLPDNADLRVDSTATLLAKVAEVHSRQLELQEACFESLLLLKHLFGESNRSVCTRCVLQRRHSTRAS